MKMKFDNGSVTDAMKIKGSHGAKLLLAFAQESLMTLFLYTNFLF